METPPPPIPAEDAPPVSPAADAPTPGLRPVGRAPRGLMLVVGGYVVFVVGFEFYSITIVSAAVGPVPSS